MTASDLKAATDKLNASIEKFLGSMNAHQARLDGYADEVERLTARITDLEKRLADSGK